MNSRGKLKNKIVMENVQPTDVRIVNDEGQVLTKDFSLLLSLEPEDDFPHPRHLCFTYPFGKSSPKTHCSKCYCYVCEEIAPCKMWKKNPKRHCDATDKDDKWKLERKYRKKLPGSTTMIYHELTVSASNLFPDGPNVPIPGFSGGLICDNNKNWVVGISMRLLNNVDPSDHSVSFYITLLEGLQLAWSKGLRYLDVKLGFVFHNYFWDDFTADSVTRKLRLCVDQICCRASQTMAILKQVEDYLNQEWFISVRNTKSIEEETGAFTVATLAVSTQDQSKKVYDFIRSYPLPPETYTRDIEEGFREMADFVFDRPADRKYFGLN